MEYHSFAMSKLFLKSFLKRPLQVASIIPSSRTLVNRVARRFDFSEPRLVVELGPGEGVHTRELVKRMHPESRMLLFELDDDLVTHLRTQFEKEDRVEVIHADAAMLPQELEKRGWSHCDYVLSGIPFSILPAEKKRKLIQGIFEALKPEPHAAFVIYQVTAELKDHVPMFARQQSEYCLQNVPPMFVISFFKLPDGPESEDPATAR